MQRFIEDYNVEVDRYHRAGSGKDVDEFVGYEKVKWSRDLKQDLQRGNHARFAEDKLRVALYRPFCKKYLHYDKTLNEEVRLFSSIFPTPQAQSENRAIAITGIGSEKPFMTLGINDIIDYHLVGAGCGTQCFPFYTYDEDGTHRRENITDWALARFREHYGDESIGKWDIFHYVYGVLHRPDYRERYAENLKLELPRLPWLEDFRGVAAAGRRLAELHVDYERAEPWPLEWVCAEGTPLSYRVEQMRLSRDKTALVVNPSLTLAGIPPEVFAYRLGNRSALEWVIDQYQVKVDKRSGLRSDPNRPDDPEAIVRLVERVVRVSVETVRIVRGLADGDTAARGPRS